MDLFDNKSGDDDSDQCNFYDYSDEEKVEELNDNNNNHNEMIMIMNKS